MAQNPDEEIKIDEQKEKEFEEMIMKLTQEEKDNLYTISDELLAKFEEKTPHFDRRIVKTFVKNHNLKL